MTKRKRLHSPAPSARALFEQCTLELVMLNQRYRALFDFVNDPNTYTPLGLHSDVIPVTLERNMKKGDTLMVRVPMKFTMRSPK